MRDQERHFLNFRISNINRSQMYRVYKYNVLTTNMYV